MANKLSAAEELEVASFGRKRKLQAEPASGITLAERTSDPATQKLLTGASFLSKLGGVAEFVAETAIPGSTQYLKQKRRAVAQEEAAGILERGGNLTPEIVGRLRPGDIEALRTGMVGREVAKKQAEAQLKEAKNSETRAAADMLSSETGAKAEKRMAEYAPKVLANQTTEAGAAKTNAEANMLEAQNRNKLLANQIAAANKLEKFGQDQTDAASYMTGVQFAARLKEVGIELADYTKPILDMFKQDTGKVVTNISSLISAITKKAMEAESTKEASDLYNMIIEIREAFNNNLLSASGRGSGTTTGSTQSGKSNIPGFSSTPNKEN